MRLASYNVENLFSRASVMNLDHWADGQEILGMYSELNALLGKVTYSRSDREQMVSLIDQLGLTRSDESDYVLLRQNRGHLLKRSTNAPPEVVANGRGEWIGWLELKKEMVNDVAIKMTAKVIKDVQADILAVIEAENRIALRQFNEQLLEPIDAAYDRVMLIDGNDERGIDVGILLKSGAEIESMVSHVDDRDGNSLIFSRDCPEYLVKCGEKKVLLLVNHLKSKGYGSQAASNARRKKQAQRVRDIYELRRGQGIDLIAVVGDFNDTPDSGALAPLLGAGSDLKDVFLHDKFDDGGRPGTYGNCAKSNKIDYLLLSPALFNRVTKGGVWREGVWGGEHGTLFPHYDEITANYQAASDHAAVWAEFDL